MQHFLRLAALAAIAAPGAPAASAAAFDDPFDERLTITLDRFRSDFDTVVQVDSVRFGQGTRFGFERDLGLRRHDDINGIAATWRFAPRHAISAAAFHATRTRTASLAEEIVFDDTVYHVAALVRGKLDVEVAELIYRYAFVRRDRVRAEVLVGIHQLDLAASLAIAASTDDGQYEGDVSGRVSAGAPLPVLGAGVSWAITPRFYFDAEGQALKAEVNDIDGTITDWRAGFRWRALEHFDVGLYYNRFDMSLDLERRQWTGQLDFAYRGPQLTGTLRF